MTLVFLTALAMAAPSHQVRAQWLPVVKAAAQHYDLDWHLVDAMIWEESNWDPNAVSHAGAEGLTQLMPETAEMLKVNNSFDAGQAIWGAAWYLAQLRKRFESWHLVLAAYNAGPTRVAACSCIPFNETNIYVSRVMSRYVSRQVQRSSRGGAY